MQLVSPIDLREFSTPPTTPFVIPDSPSRQEQAVSTQSRRMSRPQMIQIAQPEEGAFQVETGNGTPILDAKNLHSRHLMNSIAPSPQSARTVREGTVASAVPQHLTKPSPIPKSPCFVHSLLDKGISLTDWLRETTGSESSKSDGVQDKELYPPGQSTPSRSSSITSSPSNDDNSLGFIPSPTEFDDEEDSAGNLTRQLAATAIGVREMSKQLGRARVRSNIQNVMIITKARDNRLIKLTRDLALYLMSKKAQGGRGLIVYVDHQLRTSKRFDAEGIKREHPVFFQPQPRRFSGSSSVSLPSLASDSTTNGKEEGQLRYWTSDMCSSRPHLFDFVVTLGGDGTVLFTSWLFQRIVPPVLPFALGSLGFLTNFDFADHQKVMDGVLDNGIRVNLRMRFTCTVYRAVSPHDMSCKKRKAVRKGDTGEIMMKNIEEGGWDAVEGNSLAIPHTYSKDKEIMCYTTRPVESFEVLNDLVVDRGPSPYVSLLELFGDEHHMTTVQADGLTISTPTGSTAYSLSAGGSLVHPEIPAILITPICPHTLSFRPMLLPDSMELRVCVPYNSRSTAWASFDGRGRVELKQGDHIKITASKFPFPTVCADKQSTDWFHAISRTLKWNERERQKSFVVVEENAEQPHKKKSRSRKHDATPSASDRVKLTRATDDKPEPEVGLAKGGEQDGDDDDEEEEEEEEEEKFDIDDSSPEAAGVTATESSTARTSRTVSPSQDHIPPSSSSDELSGGPTSHAAQRAAATIGGSKLTDPRADSGIDTPGRLAGPTPHPPRVHSRHIIARQESVDSEASSPTTGLLDLQTPRPHDLQHHHRHSPQHRHHANPTPRSAELMTHAKKTAAQHVGHRRGRSVGDPGMTRRTAFAVYGQDESDSNASD